jgi:hypothetical protein
VRRSTHEKNFNIIIHRIKLRKVLVKLVSWYRSLLEVHLCSAESDPLLCCFDIADCFFVKPWQSSIKIKNSAILMDKKPKRKLLLL